MPRVGLVLPCGPTTTATLNRPALCKAQPLLQGSLVPGCAGRHLHRCCSSAEGRRRTCTGSGRGCEDRTVMEILVRLLDPDLPAPSRAFAGDAGIDLCARIDTTLTAVTGPRTVPTGVEVAIPDGYVGFVCSRSGLAATEGIAVLNGPGVIDSGYRGEIRVILFSVREEAKVVRRGSKIAQLVVVEAPVWVPAFVKELPPSARGRSGLGSSHT